MRVGRPARWLNAGLLAAVAVAGTVSCSDDPDATPAVPAAIINVSPADGFVGPAPPQISVTLELQRDGGVDIDSVRLSVDGRDVTDRARRAGTDDLPQSRGALTYDVEPALGEGGHRAEVQYRGGDRTYRYTWEFTVRG